MEPATGLPMPTSEVASLADFQAWREVGDPARGPFQAFLSAALGDLSRKVCAEHERGLREAQSAVRAPAPGRGSGRGTPRCSSAPAVVRLDAAPAGTGSSGGAPASGPRRASRADSATSSIEILKQEGGADGRQRTSARGVTGAEAEGDDAAEKLAGGSSAMAQFGAGSQYVDAVGALAHRRSEPIEPPELIALPGLAQRSLSPSDSRCESPDRDRLSPRDACDDERPSGAPRERDSPALATPSWSRIFSTETHRTADVPTPDWRPSALVQGGARRKQGRRLTSRPRVHSTGSEIATPQLPVRHAARKGTTQSAASNASGSMLGAKAEHERRSSSHEGTRVLALLDVWERARTAHSSKQSGARGSPSTRASATSHALDDMAGKGDAQKRARWVMSPNSSARLAWDTLSVLCISYDIIMAPLEFLELDSAAHVAMQWPLRLFWTLDIFFTLFTGYQLPNGTEEFFLRKIWVRYASSWLVPDALIVSLDWAEWILAGRAGLLSGWRLLRMIRFLRLLRLRKFLSLVVQRAKSQKAALLFGIAQSLAAILCLAHGMACIWVGIGRRDDQGWVAHVTRESAGDGVEATRTNGQTYLLALHWALTNFAGTMEVQPQTFWERFYAIFALAFGFLVASAFVSSITSNLTRLSMLSGRRAGEFKDLNTYLQERLISRSLRNRVLANAQHVIAEQEAHLPEENVKLLHDISEPLRQELHFEIYSGLLSVHPLFALLRERNPQMMKRICHEGINTVLVAENEIIFSADEVPSDPPQMIFIEKGRLQYYRIAEQKIPDTILPGQWASEHVLWTDWVYQGTLLTASACRLIMLDAVVFQQVLTSKAHQGTIGFDVSRYAAAFIELINYQRRIASNTDVGSTDISERVVAKSLMGERMGDRPAESLDERRPSASSLQDTMREFGSWLTARRPSSNSISGSGLGSRTSSKSPRRLHFPWRTSEPVAVAPPERTDSFALNGCDRSQSASFATIFGADGVLPAERAADP